MIGKLEAPAAERVGAVLRECHLVEVGGLYGVVGVGLAEMIIVADVKIGGADGRDAARVEPVLPDYRSRGLLP